MHLRKEDQVRADKAKVWISMKTSFQDFIFNKFYLSYIFDQFLLNLARNYFIYEAKCFLTWWKLFQKNQLVIKEPRKDC